MLKTEGWCQLHSQIIIFWFPDFLFLSIRINKVSTHWIHQYAQPNEIKALVHLALTIALTFNCGVQCFSLSSEEDTTFLNSSCNFIDISSAEKRNNVIIIWNMKY